MLHPPSCTDDGQIWCARIDRNRVHKLRRSNASTFLLPQRRAKPEPHQTRYSDIDDLEHAALENVLDLTNSFAARGRWKFWGNQTPST